MPSQLPYGRHWVDEADIQAVAEVLRSDWLTTGPLVEAFERAIAEFVGAHDAVAASSGTAALHMAMYAAGIGPGDEVLVPTMTFIATANAVVFQGGTPVFVDVNPDTLLLDPAEVEAKITERTKAIIAVDYAGHPCPYEALRAIANRHGLLLIADACHALGAAYRGKRVGTLADLTVFSFHPVKHITTGEGGMVVTDHPEFAARMRRFRNHGITVDHRQRTQQVTWQYDVEDLGYNYRISDIQCALGLSQLRNLPQRLTRRRELAARYDAASVDHPLMRPLEVRPDVSHAYHLYVVCLRDGVRARAAVFSAMRAEGIGVNVHYLPVHLYSFYQQRFGTTRGMCPVAEAMSERILTLPLFDQMSNEDVRDVMNALDKVRRDPVKACPIA